MHLPCPPMSSGVRYRPIKQMTNETVVVFDSQTPIGTGQGVYMAAAAEELTGVDLQRGIVVFSRRSVAHGAREWTVEDVQAPAPYRLYRTTASAHSVLDPAGHPDRRTPMAIGEGEER